MPDENNPHSAREAAEALFKPAKQSSEPKAHDVQIDPDATLDHQPVHKPRILPVHQTQPGADPEQPAVSKSAKKPRRLPARNVGLIPKSEYGRIRALVTYGMTVAQVAEVYGLAESEVELVVAAKA